MIGEFRTYVLLLLTLLLAACGGDKHEEEEKVVEHDLPPGVVPIGGEGRPQSLAEATSGESNVALWEVRDEDTIVYLMGTVHVMRGGVEWRTNNIRLILEQTDAIYLEADVFSRDAQRAMGLLVGRTAENEGDTKLSSFFDEYQKKHMDEILAGFDLKISELDSYRPWFATMQIGLAAVYSAGGDPGSGAEVVLVQDALENNRELRFLETATEQIALLASGNDKQDAAYMYDMIDTLVDTKAYYSDLVGAWFQGDVERIDFLVNDALKDYPDLRTRLLVERNYNWGHQIDRLLTDEYGIYLIAVGAGHLSGDESVQAVLEGRGYEVTRIDN